MLVSTNRNIIRKYIFKEIIHREMESVHHKFDPELF